MMTDMIGKLCFIGGVLLFTYVTSYKISNAILISSSMFLARKYLL